MVVRPQLYFHNIQIMLARPREGGDIGMKIILVPKVRLLVGL